MIKCKNSFLTVLILIIINISFNSCKPEKESPDVADFSITNISYKSVDAEVKVIDDKGHEVSKRGFVWSKNAMPDIKNNQGKITKGSGEGTFSATITNLEPNTKYHVRAFAINSKGESYSNELSFKTEELDYEAMKLDYSVELITKIDSDITHESLTIGGEIVIMHDGKDVSNQISKKDSDDTDYLLTSKGIVWHTEPYPDLNTNKGVTEESNGVNKFESKITGLDAETKYYARSYAKLNGNIYYGNQVEFETEAKTVVEEEIEEEPTVSRPAQNIEACPGISSVTDADGNTYRVVKIGNQCWFAENLRTTRYHNEGNTSINKIAYNVVQETSSAGYVIYPHSMADGINSDQEMVNKFGLLYNWHAVNSENNICPPGWSVPSDNDWKILEGTVDSEYKEGNRIWNNSNSYRGHDVGKFLKSEDIWSSRGAGYDIKGFNALPAGAMPGAGIYEDAFFWTSTDPPTSAEYGTVAAWFRYIFTNNDQVFRGLENKRTAYSVRCFKNL